MLYNLKEHDRAWTVADSIIENCRDARSVFFGLIVPACFLFVTNIAFRRNDSKEVVGSECRSKGVN